jgi:hypothetical protein
MPVIAPANATNKTVTWTSSNSAIATVDAAGKVTALKTGTATITVTTTDGNKTAACEVTVVPEGAPIPVAQVTLDRETLSLIINKTLTLTATITPDEATDQTVTWTSSNSAIATVDASGTVTGIAAGTATITVTTTDGNKTATCEVTVKSEDDPTEPQYEIVEGGAIAGSSVSWFVGHAVGGGFSSGALTLVINGSGAMPDADAYDWNKYAEGDQLTSASEIVIGDEVTSIGANAFAGFKNVAYVTIGKNVTSIGAGAFSGMDELQYVKFTSPIPIPAYLDYGFGIGNLYNQCILYPKSSEQAYWDAGWNLFDCISGY